MRKVTALCMAGVMLGAMAASAQEATPALEGAAGANSITVSDQVSLFGVVTIDSVTSANGGWIAIHSDMNGQPHHVVGIAPVPAGTSPAVAVAIDGAMSTPTLYAALHDDTGEIGLFQFEKVPGEDPLVADVAPQAFEIGAIVAFDQQPLNNSVVIASTIQSVNGFLVIHADNGGQPGPVLGFAPIVAGTTSPVIVPLTEGEVTPVVFPMLHVDDNEAGVYEFGTVEGADSPLAINGIVATRPLNLTDAPTLLLADGSTLAGSTVPEVAAEPQELTVGADGSAPFVVSRIVSVGPGVVDVHAQMDGHPAVSLGHTILNDGENTDVTVNLAPPPALPDTPITPVVYPMLHSDTNANGVYEYLQIPGVDLPVVYNGAVVTIPVNVTGEGVAPMDSMMMGDGMMEGMATDEAGMGGMDMTPEATPGT